MFADKDEFEQIFIRDYLEKYGKDLIKYRSEIEGRLGDKTKLPYLFYNNSHAVITLKNKIEYLHGGEEKFPKLLEAIENADSHIHLEYYIFYAEDAIGRTIIDLLCNKAQKGVEVRMLLDDFGSKVPRSIVKQLMRAGVEIKFFRPLWTPKYLTKSNYRDHRKIVVVDGKTGFIGGINIADYYINTKDTKHYWADLHAMLHGDSVHVLQLLFYLNWRFATGESFGPLLKYMPSHQIENQLAISILGSSATSKSPAILDAYFTMINTAITEVLITTPYFIPNEAILKSILVTAKSGVDVKIIMPQSSDGYLVQQACLSYIEVLLENNVRVFLYTKGMIHSKTMVVDSRVCTLGTANIDERSFNINSEVNAFIFDERKSKELKRQFERDLLDSLEITLEEWNKRGRWTKIQESLFRLIAPLL